jgi:hypothetical protein
MNEKCEIEQADDLMIRCLHFAFSIYYFVFRLSEKQS